MTDIGKEIIFALFRFFQYPDHPPHFRITFLLSSHPEKQRHPRPYKIPRLKQEIQQIFPGQNPEGITDHPMIKYNKKQRHQSHP